MEREQQIAQVEQGFKDLAEFARSSWSNIAITERVKALHLEVKKLYPPVIVVKEVQLPPPLAIPRQKPTPRPMPEGFEPVEVTDSTRWG